MLYDRTCRGRGPRPGLSTAWGTGAFLYRTLGRLNAARGVANWAEALAWLREYDSGNPIEEIQFWGHGKWGQILVAGEPLSRFALRAGHPFRPTLEAIRARLIPGASAGWWFRTCETFGATAGQDFARAWTDFFGCRAAGHTFIIGYWQSGLHSLAPGAAPTWSADEGLASGTPQRPDRAKWSLPGCPNTITCLDGKVPAGW